VIFSKKERFIEHKKSIIIIVKTNDNKDKTVGNEATKTILKEKQEGL
jgi:hypothetical protein